MKSCQKGFARYQKVLGFAHIFLLVVIVIIGIAGVGYYAFKNGQIKLTPENENSSTISTYPTPNENKEDWKNYSSNCWGITFSYPDTINFMVTPLFDCEVFRFENNNGYMVIDGGCSANGISKNTEQSLTILGLSTPLYTNYQTGEWVTYHATTQKISQLESCVNVSMRLNSENKNEAILLFDQILSTFEFTNFQEQSTYSTEGQSCGILAGAAGNAKCGPGLICKQNNTNDPYDIGTCIKQ